MRFMRSRRVLVVVSMVAAVALVGTLAIGLLV